MGGTYGSFYTNVCKFLSTLNGGITHQRPSVKLPLSKVGLELSRILTNLGVITDFSIGQHLQRVRNHSRIWDPTIKHLSSSADAAGYPAMYLKLHLNWDKHKPIWSRTPLAAAPCPTEGHTSSSSSSQVSLPLFTPPMGFNSPTPEAVKIISKPSVQRWLGLGQLLKARSQSRPGIFLLSTHQGLLTDIDCELRGIGGIVLAHLALPMGHVVQLRGLLRSKYTAEVAAAKEAAAAGGKQQPQQPQVQHVPLAEWDARGQAMQTLIPRLASGQQEALDYLEFIKDAASAQKHRSKLLEQAQEQLLQLEMQEIAWAQNGGDSSGLAGSADLADSSRRSRISRGGSGAGRSRTHDQWRPHNA